MPVTINTSVNISFPCGQEFHVVKEGLRVSEDGEYGYALITWETIKIIKEAYDLALPNRDKLDEDLAIIVTGYDGDCMDLWFLDKGIWASDEIPYPEGKPDVTYEEMDKILKLVMPLVPKPVVKKPAAKKTTAKKK